MVTLITKIGRGLSAFTLGHLQHTELLLYPEQLVLCFAILAPRNPLVLDRLRHLVSLT